MDWTQMDNPKMGYGKIKALPPDAAGIGREKIDSCDQESNVKKMNLTQDQRLRRRSKNVTTYFQ